MGNSSSKSYLSSLTKEDVESLKKTAKSAGISLNDAAKVGAVWKRQAGAPLPHVVDLVQGMREEDKKLRKVAPTLVDAYVRRNFASYDANDDGSIEFDEFVHLYAALVRDRGTLSGGESSPAATPSATPEATSTLIANETESAATPIAKETATEAAGTDVAAVAGQVHGSDGVVADGTPLGAAAEGAATEATQEETVADPVPEPATAAAPSDGAGDTQAHEEAETQAKEEAEVKAKEEAEAQAKEQAEAQAKEQAEAQSKEQAQTSAEDEAHAPAASPSAEEEVPTTLAVAARVSAHTPSMSLGTSPARQEGSPIASPAARLLEKGRSSSMVSRRRKGSVLFTAEEESAWSGALRTIHASSALQKGRSKGHNPAMHGADGIHELQARLVECTGKLPEVSDALIAELPSRLASTPLACDEQLARFLVLLQRLVGAQMVNPNCIILADILTFEATRSMFRDALSGAMCVENFDFYYGVQLLRHSLLSSASDPEVAELLSTIRSRFLDDSSESVINVSGAAKAEALRQVDSLNEGGRTLEQFMSASGATDPQVAAELVFKKAEHEVYQNMTSSFASFFDANPAQYVGALTHAIVATGTEFGIAQVQLVRVLKEAELYESVSDLFVG